MTGGGVLMSSDAREIDPKNQQFTFEIFKVAVLSAVGEFFLVIEKFGVDTFENLKADFCSATTRAS